ncbi:MAG: choice-of-anchor tandem repeat NxxGxxAF-containing protein [Pseudomonadota bacterium]
MVRNLTSVWIALSVRVGLSPSIAGDSPQFSVVTEVLVSSGDPSPDGNGVFGDQFTPPVLNNSGQALFVASLLATTNPDPIDDLGLFRASSGAVNAMTRGGDPSAAGNLLDLDVLRVAGQLTRRQLLGIDQAGEVAFLASDSDNQDAIYRSDGQALSTVVQQGEDLPFGDNLRIGAAVLGFLMNDVDQLAYLLDSDTQNLLVRSDGLVTEAVFGTGQALPGANTLIALRAFGMNNSGEVIARLNVANDAFGHFVGDPSNVRQINQTGAAAPDGLGTFIVDPRLPAAINDSSTVALVGGVDDVTTDYVGVYLEEGTGLTEVTRTGNGTVGGTLLAVASGLQLNDRGDLLYAILSSDNNRLQRLVMRRDGAVLPVASEGDLVIPAEGGLINSFNGYSLNDAGQVLIFATVVRPGLPQALGLYLFDPLAGLTEVVRVGQSLAGGTITALGAALPLWPLEANTIGNAQTGLNDAGQVAFSYTLDSGENGVALSTVSIELPDMLFKDSFEALIP